MVAVALHRRDGGEGPTPLPLIATALPSERHTIHHLFFTGKPQSGPSIIEEPGPPTYSDRHYSCHCQCSGPRRHVKNVRGLLTPMSVYSYVYVNFFADVKPIYYWARAHEVLEYLSSGLTFPSPTALMGFKTEPSAESAFFYRPPSGWIYQ